MLWIPQLKGEVTAKPTLNGYWGRLCPYQDTRKCFSSSRTVHSRSHFASGINICLFTGPRMTCNLYVMHTYPIKLRYTLNVLLPMIINIKDEWKGTKGSMKTGCKNILEGEASTEQKYKNVSIRPGQVEMMGCIQSCTYLWKSWDCLEVFLSAACQSSGEMFAQFKSPGKSEGWFTSSRETFHRTGVGFLCLFFAFCFVLIIEWQQMGSNAQRGRNLESVITDDR